MNVRKMRQIGKDILAEPRRFNMGHWARAIEGKSDANIIGHAKSAMPPCGTVVCFAGEWALRYLKMTPEELYNLATKQNTKAHVSYVCQEDLELPNQSLFYEDQWPDEVKPSRKIKPGTKKYAEHFVNVVLESYIRTNGWENGKA